MMEKIENDHDRKFYLATQKAWILFVAWLRTQTGQLACVALVAIAIGYGIGFARAGKYSDDKLIANPRASMSKDGKAVTFQPESPALNLIQTKEAKAGTATLSFTAPARIVATAALSTQQGDRVILFESADITSLYSQYRQAKGNFLRSSRNFRRTKEMYNNEAATAKDLNDAENDFATSKAVFMENEVKLRTAGYNPDSLETLKPKTAWLISDIPEAQINEVERGEAVKVDFSAMPGEITVGKAESIGDAIDPVTRTIKVRVVLPNPNGKILPGMFARADFGTLQNGTVVVPITSLVSVDDKNYIFIAKSPTEFEARVVTVAATSGESVAVTSGLKLGEQVVSKGAMLLKGVYFSF